MENVKAMSMLWWVTSCTRLCVYLPTQPSVNKIPRLILHAASKSDHSDLTNLILYCSLSSHQYLCSHYSKHLTKLTFKHDIASSYVTLDWVNMYFSLYYILIHFFLIQWECFEQSRDNLVPSEALGTEQGIVDMQNWRKDCRGITSSPKLTVVGLETQVPTVMEKQGQRGEVRLGTGHRLELSTKILQVMWNRDQGRASTPIQNLHL